MPSSIHSWRIGISWFTKRFFRIASASSEKLLHQKNCFRSYAKEALLRQLMLRCATVAKAETSKAVPNGPEIQQNALQLGGCWGSRVWSPVNQSHKDVWVVFFCYLGRNEEVSLVQYINSWQTSKKNLEHFFVEQFSFAAGTTIFFCCGNLVPATKENCFSNKKNYSTLCDGLTTSHTHDS